jgi:predicted acyltransferase
MNVALKRIAAIDVFRAFTMLCMIFVNDLWSLSGVPHWLEHAAAHEDFLGFSDIVFPSFLFALGMSIPFAVENRIRKGEAKLQIIQHIILRSLALIVMGLFAVNTEGGISETVGMNKTAFTTLTVIAFFMIWNMYPKSIGWKKYLYRSLQIAGIAILIWLTVIFRDSGGMYIQSHWWGILGLIGWTYFLCALIYLFVRQRFWVNMAIMLLFTILCMAGSSYRLGFFDSVIVSNGALHVFAMAGILVSLWFMQFAGISVNNKLLLLLASSGVMILTGLLIRSFWIISKIVATPTWVFLCTGIATIIYVIVYWLVEVKKLERFFRLIKPAGTATLTCYIIPGIVCNIFVFIGFSLPSVVLQYPSGLLKSLAFAFLVIGITAILGKIHIKLKI